ncbi:hypothetical protein HMPREF1624_04908 [Sporothrix schenckii ATCC 58251]|uniref:Uncharacterized protein n=1 Tax=Sporothrix schenckii (strain ATCC 58251 / de Perez 2211183) TaxID=1391915 RepID=U7PR46_SPOS1|nr:hypothetical protein HMPREF1624_04908 [Sporothrix schenckii ATCC 58251]
MPSSIPYDPSLVLANIVTPATLTIVQDISVAQADVDSAEEELNALLSTKRSLESTRLEISNLGFGKDDIGAMVGPLDAAIDGLLPDIKTAAVNYANAKIEAEKKIRPLRAKLHAVHTQAESPVDYNKTQVKAMQLASDSMNMNVQFFSVDKNDQHGTAHASNVAAFVSSSLDIFGSKFQQQASGTAQSQTANQYAQHKIAGTLVISASCTHKNASVLAPCILNVDKGIRAWNRIFPDAADRITPTSLKGMKALIDGPAGDAGQDKHFSVLTGMTYGSSFVGMVHIVNTKSDDVTHRLSSMVDSLQEQMTAGAWFEDASGGFGVNASFGDEVKSLLSAQNITSHVTLISMGIIPSIKSNNIAMGVREFADFDPKSSMEALASIQNATAAGQSTIGEAAEAARLGQKMLSLKSSGITASLAALGDIDKAENQVLDINSLMTALDDYVAKVASAESGVPLNYYLTEITKSMLAEMWVAKYFPKQNTPQNDDTDRPEPGE